MADDKPLNSPAFPVVTDQVRSMGMTLRDYFAAKALASEVCPASSNEHDKVAAWCYKMADAMLAAREADHA